MGKRDFNMGSGLAEEKEGCFSDDAQNPLLDDSPRLSQLASFYQTLRQPCLLTASLIFFCLSLVFLIFTVSITFHRPGNYCVKKLSSYPPGLDILDDNYQTVQFSGHRTKYRGPPNEEVDAAWAQLTKFGVFNLDHETLQKINAPEYAVKLPESSGGGYMAVFEYIHHLHCLNTLRQTIYPEYYRNRSASFMRTPENAAKHLGQSTHHPLQPQLPFTPPPPPPYQLLTPPLSQKDHCIDTLRQKLMCDADINVITYNWYDDSDYPVANFDIPHKCRDFEKLQDWVYRHHARTPGGRVYKPKDAVELHRVDVELCVSAKGMVKA
ncbi:MAG: hypothetical protein M1830_007182 [Pleopsidium flavum]|nr:MAG: hypothetical protein M1830_007182 [Pleopsidium flavum]